MSDFKKKILQDKIKEAIIYNRLRELGRWLTIKNINVIRTSLLSYAKTQGLNDLQNVYFTNINEIIDNQADEIVCKKEKIFTTNTMIISCQTQLLHHLSKENRNFRRFRGISERYFAKSRIQIRKNQMTQKLFCILKYYRRT